MGTNDPDVLGLQSTYSISFWISHFQPQKRYSPDRARLPFDTRLGPKHFGGLGGEVKNERRGENRHVACTVMSIANSASYCYSGWLCIDLSSAILAGHGY